MRSRSGRYRRNRKRELLLLALFVLVLFAVRWMLPEPETQNPTGVARVIDGDSVIVSGTEIRLLGIDAPERDQNCVRGGADWQCGRESARRLRAFLGRARVSCSGNSFDKHGRLLAVCRRGDVEVNQWLVEQGWAVSYDNYPAAERAARKAGRGIWSGTFEQPRDWRERNRGR